MASTKIRTNDSYQLLFCAASNHVYFLQIYFQNCALSSAPNSAHDKRQRQKLSPGVGDARRKNVSRRNGRFCDQLGTLLHHKHSVWFLWWMCNRAIRCCGQMDALLKLGVQPHCVRVYEQGIQKGILHHTVWTKTMLQTKRQKWNHGSNRTYPRN